MPVTKIVDAHQHVNWCGKDHHGLIKNMDRQGIAYSWIMARSPQISDEDYKRLLSILEEQGYDTTKVRKVPQYWKDSE